MGFEPTRGDPIGLAGRRLSHSAKVSNERYKRLYALCHVSQPLRPFGRRPFAAFPHWPKREIVPRDTVVKFPLPTGSRRPGCVHCLALSARERGCCRCLWMPCVVLSCCAFMLFSRGSHHWCAGERITRFTRRVLIRSCVCRSVLNVSVLMLVACSLFVYIDLLPSIALSARGRGPLRVSVCCLKWSWFAFVLPFVPCSRPLHAGKRTDCCIVFAVA